MILASAELGLWKPVLVLGVLQAGLYGLLPIAFVLSYRVSRTVAFVHGGTAGACGFVYWVLVYNGTFVPGRHPGLPPWLGLVLAVLLGGVLGGSFGAFTLSRRISRLPAMTLTVISLGTMMILLGIVTKVFLVHPAVLPPSPFGDGSVGIWGVQVTRLRAFTFVAAAVLVAGLGFFLKGSFAGRTIQAICDDLDASTWCGVRVQRIGGGVHAACGAIAGLAGVLVVSTLGPDPLALFQVMLRGLAVAVIGGLLNFPLALTGALLVGLAETAFQVGLFGEVPLGGQELIVNGAVVVMILAVTQARRAPAVLERRTL